MKQSFWNIRFLNQATGEVLVLDYDKDHGTIQVLRWLGAEDNWVELAD